MNQSRSNDSEIGSEGCPPKPISTLSDLQVKAYENRVRERLIAKYPKRTPAEARRLEKQIEKLVQIYAEGRILLQSDTSNRIRQNHQAQGIERTPEFEVTDEREERPATSAISQGVVRSPAIFLSMGRAAGRDCQILD